MNKLFGLVLCGGQSTRMGEDKGEIRYHGIPQREYLYELLDQICAKTYLSIRPEQEPTIPKNYNIILDENEYKGPYNGLLSAHKKHPEEAWLVLACDLPLINLKAVEDLLLARDATKLATAYTTQESGLPEPLIAIWEPKGLKLSINYLQDGTSTCPRKFLINADTKLIFSKNKEVLLNANSKEEYEIALQKLN